MGTPSMVPQNTKKNILVVCEMCNRLKNVNMCMFWTLAACELTPSPHHQVPDLVNYAMCLLKIPLIFFPTLIRQVLFKDIQKLYRLLLQDLKFSSREVPLTTEHIPLNTLDKNQLNFITWIYNMFHPMKSVAYRSIIDEIVDELYLYDIESHTL
jgi:hypothetical protein